jgi:hypothetical protein
MASVTCLRYRVLSIRLYVAPYRASPVLTTTKSTRCGPRCWLGSCPRRTWRTASSFRRYRKSGISARRWVHQLALCYPFVFHLDSTLPGTNAMSAGQHERATGVPGTAWHLTGCLCRGSPTYSPGYRCIAWKLARETARLGLGYSVSGGCPSSLHGIACSRCTPQCATMPSLGADWLTRPVSAGG